MIPVGTDVRLRRRPVANYVLIALNVSAFILTSVVGDAFTAAFLTPLDADVPSLFQYLTYQFQHGDLTHLLGNMLFLFIFGNPVCDRMGGLAYTLFYLAGGVVAGAYFAVNSDSSLIGASGSIAAVTTAFMVLFPRVHVTLLLIFIIITPIQIPAMLLIVFKIILWDNVLAPYLDRGVASSAVAFDAHLAGYAFGFVVAMILLAVRALPRNNFDLLALWGRWRRRTGFVPAPSRRGPVVARPVRVEQIDSRPLDALRPEPAEQLREDVLSRMAERDFAEAAQLYRKLRALAPGVVLPRREQQEIANFFAQSSQHHLAVDAYEAFLQGYPTASDAPQIRLLIGIFCSKYLNDPRKAVDYLSAAVEGLSNPSQQQLARDELRAARAAAGIPEPPDPGTPD